jgi:hypothetical protein
MTHVFFDEVSRNVYLEEPQDSEPRKLHRMEVDGGPVKKGDTVGICYDAPGCKTPNKVTASDDFGLEFGRYIEFRGVL